MGYLFASEDTKLYRTSNLYEWIEILDVGSGHDITDVKHINSSLSVNGLLTCVDVTTSPSFYALYYSYDYGDTWNTASIPNISQYRFIQGPTRIHSTGELILGGVMQSGTSASTLLIADELDMVFSELNSPLPPAAGIRNSTPVLCPYDDYIVTPAYEYSVLGRIYRSTNKGTSWVSEYSWGRSVTVFSAVDFGNGNLIVAESNSSNYTYVHSTDYGDTWNLKSLTSTSVSQISSIVIKPDEVGVALIFCSNGLVSRVEDYGATLINDYGMINSAVRGVAYLGNNLFIAGNDTSDVKFSFDGGLNWELYPELTPNESGAVVKYATGEILWPQLELVGTVPSSIHDGQEDFELIGTDFLDSGAVIELGSSSDYGSATLVTLPTKTQNTNSLTTDIDVTGLPVQDHYYFFVTSSIGQRNDIGYSVPFIEGLAISSITPNTIYNDLVNIVITGVSFGSTGAIVELCDSSDYGSATEHIAQTVTYQDDTTLIITADVGTLLTFNYIHVTNTFLDRDNILVYVYAYEDNNIDSLILSFTTGTASESVLDKFGGYGQDAVGRHQYGAPGSLIEPRFDTSLPGDEVIEVSTRQWITFSTYHFSSIGDFKDGLGFEISEDNGESFSPISSPAYELVQRVKDGQRFWFKIRKRVGTWPSSTYIVVRYTGPDEHGNIATKAAPIRWS